jgi:hypothetical protein
MLTTANTVPDTTEATTEATTVAQTEETEVSETAETEAPKEETETTTEATEKVAEPASEETSVTEATNAAEVTAGATEATTEETTAETEAQKVDLSSLPMEHSIALKDFGGSYSEIVMSVLDSYGIECTSDELTAINNVKKNDAKEMTDQINQVLSKKGAGFEAIDMTGYTMDDVTAELANNNPVIYWDSSEFGAFFGYVLSDVSVENDTYSFISESSFQGTCTSPYFYEKASSVGCPAIVIHKK